ncbi:NrfD/PsrC family molybdoenzyme membrane anchor subunit [Chloroflexota bacterium]
MPYSTTTIDEFSVGYDFQKEWVERRGLLIAMAFYLGEAGTGLFLGSLLVGWKLGLIIGIGIVAIGDGGCHLLYLGRPLRFWRAFWRPQSSWISRGMFILVLFIIFGLAYYFVGSTALLGITVFLALCVMLYVGFAMAFSASMPFWNNALLPVMFIGTGLASGMSLLLTIYSFAPQTLSDTAILDLMGPVLAIILVILIGVYMWTNYFSSIAARESVKFLGTGRFSSIFYSAVVLLGLVIPLAILIPAYFGSVPLALLSVAGICALLGSFALRYSLLKAGIYPPIV